MAAISMREQLSRSGWLVTTRSMWTVNAKSQSWEQNCFYSVKDAAELLRDIMNLVDEMDRT